MILRGHQCGMPNPVERRDHHGKLEQMFIAVRMSITDEQGSRACLMIMERSSCRCGLASAIVSVLLCLSTVIASRRDAGRSSCSSGLPVAVATRPAGGEAPAVGGRPDERWRSRLRCGY
jgi:hypothetical protein